MIARCCYASPTLVVLQPMSSSVSFLLRLSFFLFHLFSPFLSHAFLLPLFHSFPFPSLFLPLSAFPSFPPFFLPLVFSPPLFLPFPSFPFCPPVLRLPATALAAAALGLFSPPLLVAGPPPLAGGGVGGPLLGVAVLAGCAGCVSFSLSLSPFVFLLFPPPPCCCSALSSSFSSSSSCLLSHSVIA